MKAQFKTWFVNYFMFPFSWSRWTDILTFSYSGAYLLQGRVNSRSNAKQFRITGMQRAFAVSKPTTPSMTQLDACKLCAY